MPGGFAVSVDSLTYRSVLLDTAGAVAGQGADSAVAWHYGDPLREQRQLAERAAFVDRSNREILTVRGEDRLRWLNDITTQKTVDLADGAVTETLVLSVTGHVEHHAHVTELAGAVWLDVEPGAAAGMLAFLDSMRFSLRVEPSEVTADWAILTLGGAQAPAVLAGLGVGVPGSGRSAPLVGGGWIRAMVGAPTSPPSYDLLIDRAELTAWTQRLIAAGATAAGLGAYEALRIEARRPRQGFETDHKTIPNELSWLRTAVHLTKGCYRGQETVARVHNLGRPPRRLALVHFDGVSEELPPRGSEVTVDGRTVGSVTSAAWHYELGPIALLVLKRSVPDTADLLVAATMASIDPDPDAPGADVVPAGRAARDRLSGKGGSATISA